MKRYAIPAVRLLIGEDSSTLAPPLVTDVLVTILLLGRGRGSG